MKLTESKGKINSFKGLNYPEFILGTGVIPYNTPRENIVSLRKIIR